jgi:hypothetical protein
MEYLFKLLHEGEQRQRAVTCAPESGSNHSILNNPSDFPVFKEVTHPFGLPGTAARGWGDLFFIGYIASFHPCSI